MNCGGEDTSVRAEKGKVFTVCASINAAGHLQAHWARKDRARLSSPPGCGGGSECVFIVPSYLSVRGHLNLFR